MQCCLSAAVDRDSTDTYRTYWFDADVVDSIVSAASAGTLDLIDADYDDYIIDTDYEGMDHFDMRRTGSNGFEADKFQLSNSTSYAYSTNLDIRYEVFDEVDIYTFFRTESGSISTVMGMARTLDAVALAMSAVVMSASVMSWLV